MIFIFFQQCFSFEMCFYRVSGAEGTNEGFGAPRIGFFLLRAALEPMWGLGALLTSASSDRNESFRVQPWGGDGEK